MTISYPLSLPVVTAGGYSQITFEPEHVQGRVRSPFTGQEQVYDYQAERWKVKIVYTAMELANARLIQAFLLSLRGSVGTFLIGDDLQATPSGVATGTPLVNGASQTGRSLITDGWTNTITGILKAGDYFQLNNYLYMNLKDVNSNGSGQATFDIFPALRAAPADNDALTLTNPKGLFRLEDGSVQWDSGADRLYRCGFSAVEAL